MEGGKEKEIERAGREGGDRDGRGESLCSLSDRPAQEVLGSAPEAAEA